MKTVTFMELGGGPARVSQSDVEVRYPFGRVTISHLNGGPTAALIKILGAPFEGFFEKQRRLEGGIVEHIEKGDPEGNEPFELIKGAHRPPYFREILLMADPRKCVSNRTGVEIISLKQNVDRIKGRKELINTRDPRQFSCYQMKSEALESMFGREKCDEEMQLCSQLLYYYYSTIPENTVPSDEDLENYLCFF